MASSPAGAHRSPGSSEEVLT